MKIKLYLIVLLLLSLLCSARNQDISESLFKKYETSLCQINLIENLSGKKSSSGSGFFLNSDGLIATNYHVIADIINYTDKFHLEAIFQDETIDTLRLVDFDIVHDLALVTTGKISENYLAMSVAELFKGQKIYSLGNPKQLGMSIIEGTFNGFLANRRVEEIFFSGSLNPGMSGGPAINSDGEVVGINVATEGEEISYLVPVKFLQKLKEHQKSLSLAADTLNTYIGKQLYRYQNEYMKKLFDTDWEIKVLGKAGVVNTISDIFMDWGSTGLDKKNLFDVVATGGRTEDYTYINDDLTIGELRFMYYWLESNKISDYQFYNIYESYFSQVLGGKWGAEEDFSNWETINHFVDIKGQNWKIIFGARQYKKFPELYDVIFNACTTDMKKQGLIIKVSLEGLSKENAVEFTTRLIERIEWEN